VRHFIISLTFYFSCESENVAVFTEPVSMPNNMVVVLFSDVSMFSMSMWSDGCCYCLVFALCVVHLYCGCVVILLCVSSVDFFFMELSLCDGTP